VPFLLDAKTLEMGCNFTFDTVQGELDALGELEPCGPFEQLLPGSELYELGQVRVRTIGLDDLIRIKRHIRRPKDADSLAQLLAIKQVREEMSRRGEGPNEGPSTIR